MKPVKEKDPLQGKAQGKRWFAQAKRQLTFLDYFLSQNASDFVCFFCQQSVEMGLKAIITLKKGRSPRIHSIQQMVKIAAEDYPEIIGSLDCLNDLDPYYIAARYFEGFPDGLPLDHLTQKDAEKAAEIARNFISVISKYF